ncbi:MAG TPA: SRPBCC family protein [Candidatus Acidoferrum sp.]|nr:SRPBCC family protein [Candidatus Acidoferrum sp.]
MPEPKQKPTTADRIEKKILLRAPLKRVWRALSDSKEFGTWFGVKFDAPFKPGTRMTGRIVGTAVDVEVATLQKHYEHIPFEITIDRIEPERLFSFRWHPNAVEPGVDYSKEATTLIEFTLEEVLDGVLLTVTESGFDQIPLDRRAKAFEGNEKGWGMVIQLVEKYLAKEA